MAVDDNTSLIMKFDTRKGRLLQQQVSPFSLDVYASNNTVTYSSVVGEAQYSDLQTAVDAVSATGLYGTVIVLEGNHIQANSIVVPSGVSIIGLRVDDSIIDFNSGAYGFTFTSSDNFNLQSLRIINSTATTLISISACNNASIVNCNIYDCTVQSGIYIENGSDNILIENCDFGISASTSIINIVSCFNPKIMYCNVSGTRCLEIQNPYNITVEGNAFGSSSSTIPVEIYRNLTSASADISAGYINKNEIFSTSAASKALNVYGTAADKLIKNMVITNNMFRGRSGSNITNGLYLEYAYYCIVNGNYSLYVSSQGIVLDTNTDRCTVVGNVSSTGITNSGTNNQVASNVVS